MTRVTRLLCTTSLCALAGGPAVAAEPVRLELGGFFRAFAVAGDQDDGPGEPGAGIRTHGIARESEVFFLGTTTLPNGISVGVDIQLEGETSPDQIDESYVWFEGLFGKLQIGSKDPASDALLFGPPVPLPGHGVNSPNLFHVAAGTNLVGTSQTFVNQTFDSDKVTYFTPRWQGFQLGLSYTPDNTEELGFGFRPDMNAGQFSEAIEGGGNWIGRAGPVDIGVHVAVGHGEREVGGPGLDDRRQWGAGGQLGWRGLVLGASFRQDDLGVSGSDRLDWNLGAAYTTGPWTVAAAFAHGEVDLPTGGEDELDHLEVGARYLVGPGITLAAGMQYVDFDSPRASARNQAWLGLVGTEVAF
jgi:predicted porin